MNKTANTIKTILQTMLTIALIIFLYKYVFIQKKRYNGKISELTHKIDSLKQNSENLRDSIDYNKTLIDSLQKQEKLLNDTIDMKDKEIEKLKKKKNEKINIINNGSAIDSYNRLSDRYTR